MTRPTLENAKARELYAHASRWRTSGDTLLIRVFTGLVGWDVMLRPEFGHYVGTARYLTDAGVLGAPPLIVPVVAKREACPRDTD